MDVEENAGAAQPIVEPEPIDEENLAERNNEIRKIMHLVKYLHITYMKKEYEVKDEHVIDLDLSCDLSGILHTVFTYLRKESNVNSDRRGNMNGDKIAKIGPVSHSIVFLANNYKKATGYSNFNFMVATPIVDLLTSFKCMWSEIRMSCGKFDLRVGGEKVTKKLSDYGLDNTAIPYMTGITFKPERRAGLIKTLGPLALSILLANETNYVDKLDKALREELKTMRFCNAYVDCLRGLRNANEAGELFKSLSMYLMITGSRQHNKIHPPLLYFYSCYLTISNFLNKWNFSGIRGLLIYSGTATKFIWKKKAGGLPEQIAQVVFHSMFGTAVEDLGVLSQITNNQSWYRRSELNSVFQKQSLQDGKTFTPVLFTLYSKLSQANMISNAQTDNPQINSRIVFAGSRKRTFSKAFLNYMESGQHGTNFSTNPATLSYQICEEKDRLYKELKDGKLSQAGTVSWVKFENNQFVAVPGIVVEHGAYFYS